eukprot:2620901-Rhodomonas_salina.2
MPDGVPPGTRVGIPTELRALEQRVAAVGGRYRDQVVLSTSARTQGQAGSTPMPSLFWGAASPSGDDNRSTRTEMGLQIKMEP